MSGWGWDLPDESGAGIWPGGVDVKCAAELFGAVSHVAGPAAVGGFCVVVAVAVVGDAQGEACAGDGDVDFDAGGLRVPGDVGEGFAQGVEEVFGDVVVDDGVDGAVEADDGVEAEGFGLFGGDGEKVAPGAASGGGDGLELEDDRADVAHGEVEVVDGLLDPVGHLGLTGRESLSALEQELCGE